MSNIHKEQTVILKDSDYIIPRSEVITRSFRSTCGKPSHEYHDIDIKDYAAAYNKLHANGDIP